MQRPRRRFRRRDFLKASAASGVVAALGAKRAFGGEEPLPVRIGVVGVGNRGINIVQTLLQLPGVEIPAVCDIKEDHAARARDIVKTAVGKEPALYTSGDRDWENLVVRDDLDAVIAATPWEWHTPIMVTAMQSGKYGGTEVPAAMTIEECWNLVWTSEKTGVPCMMLENVCYFRNVLAVLKMVREGMFGELLHAEAGYQHDTRFVDMSEGKLLWRGEHAKVKNGNLYPTHAIGPISHWFNINHGDRYTRLVSMSTKSRGRKNYAAEKFGPDHPLANQEYAQGDINTSLIETEKGLTVTLYHDSGTPRPYDLIFRVQGTKGIYMGTLDKIYLEGVSPEGHQWEPFEPYMERYAHPLWEDLEAEALAHGGHGGCDYITLYEFVKAVRNRTQTPQDVYDAATWSAIVPLSIESVACGSQTVTFPDFTNGKWKTTPPLPIHGA
jgi:predicted dehydrogenase